MASELLKTFEKIEDGRQKCIQNIRDKGVQIDSNASLYNIASKIASLSNTYKDILIDYENYDIYSSPETCPDFYHFPEDWPDFRALFTQEKDIELYDRTFYPAYMLIFNTTNDTTEFYTDVMVGDETAMGKNFAKEETITPNKVRLGYVDSFTGSTKYNRSILIKYSDSIAFDALQVLEDRSDTSCIHTWDHAKDIELEDGTRLKFIMVFIQGNQSSNLSYVGKFIDCRGVDLYEAITTQKVFNSIEPSSSTGADAVLGYSKGFNCGIIGTDTYKRLIITNPFTDLAKSKTSNDNVTNSSNYANQLGINNPIVYLEIYYDDEGEEGSKQPLKNLNPRAPYSKLRVLKTNSIEFSRVSAPHVTKRYFDNIIWLKMPFVSRLYGCYSLKYLEIVPEQQQEIVFTWDASQPTRLLKENIYANIKTVTEGYTGSGYDSYLPRNIKHISFDNLENMIPYMFYNCPTYSLSFPKITTINDSSVFGSGSQIQELYLPELENLTFINLNPDAKWLPNSIRKLIVPKLTTLDYLNLNYSGTRASQLLTYLDASNATSGYETAMSYVDFLRIGKDFKQSTVYIYNNTRLEIAKYIIHQLADVSEETSTYTLNISGYTRYFLEDEVKLAESKGWVIK